MTMVFRLTAVLCLLLGMWAAVSSPVMAQDASPEAAECVAPELPPGTPTPMDDMGPGETSEAEHEHDDATPEGLTEAETDVVVAPEPLDEGTVLDGADADAAIAALHNLITCVESGDYLAVGALLTERFLSEFLGLPSVYDVPMVFEGSQPFETRTISEARSHGDGRVSVLFVYSGFYLRPGTISAERWVLVKENGHFKLDTIAPATIPDELASDATVVEVRMFDYAFVMDTTTLAANEPVIFRVSIAPEMEPHEFVLVTLDTVTSADEIMELEFEALDELLTDFYGAVYLQPGTGPGDLMFENGLEAGTYFAVCAVETAEGEEHYHLGMVMEITVE